jgi:hypothetical protein
MVLALEGGGEAEGDADIERRRVQPDDDLATGPALLPTP